MVKEFIKCDDSHSYWKVLCDCGKEKTVIKQSLTRGATKSCGCKRGIVIGESQKTHGLSRSKIYKVWHAMMQRCLNKNCASFKNYGSRGISISEPWKSFETFYKEFGCFASDGLQIERVDNNGPYSKENCRWTTHLEQQKNKRQTIWITLNGETKCCKDWSKIYAVPKNTALYRIAHGWSPEETFILKKRVKTRLKPKTIEQRPSKV